MKPKSYFSLVIRAYGTIQFSGLFLGAVFLWPTWGRLLLDSTEETLPWFLSLLLWIPASALPGFMMTAIPTILYSATLPFLIGIIEKSNNTKVTIYIGTIFLTLLFFLASGVIAGLTSARDASTFLPMLLASILAGTLGTFITIKNMHNQQVDPIVKTPDDKVEAQSTQGHRNGIVKYI